MSQSSKTINPGAPQAADAPATRKEPSRPVHVPTPAPSADSFAGIEPLLKIDAPWPAPTGHRSDALQEEYDALADLFLNEENTPQGAASISAARPDSHASATPALPKPAAPGRDAAPQIPTSASFIPQHGKPALPVQHAPSRPAAQPAAHAAKTAPAPTPTLVPSAVGSEPGAAAHKPQRTSHQDRTRTSVSTARMPPAPAIPASTGVDALVLGHLPVIASAWAVQYARHIAEVTGAPVALLRLQSGSLSLEVVFSDAEQAVTLRAGGPTANLEDAVARARAVGPRLMVRVDETSELELLAANTAAGASLLSRVAVLTGADDMAIVASYRTIKNLITAGPTSLRLPDDDESGATQMPAAGPTLEVAIMGSPLDRAQVADVRLHRAASTFLGRELPAAACISKMGVCATSALYRGQWTRSIADLMEEVAEEWLVGENPVREQAIGRSPATAAHLQAPLGPQAPHAPQPPQAPQALQTSPSFGPPPAHELTSTALGATRTQRGTGPVSCLADRLPGLAMLTSRCPYCPGIELASGEGGVLHLLTATAALGGPNEASESIGQLLAAASWADDHAQILAQAHPALREGLDKAGPILHLLTDEPRAARGLLGTGVRVHLVTTIDMDGRQAWVCRDLN